MSVALGLIAAAGITAVSSYIGNRQNNNALAKQQREARELAEKEFEWGKKIDTFNMKDADRNFMQERLGAQFQSLQTMLQNNAALAQHARALYGGGR